MGFGKPKFQCSACGWRSARPENKCPGCHGSNMYVAINPHLISNQDSEEPPAVFVATYCQLTRLDSLQAMLLMSAHLRARPQGRYRSGEEIALWGPPGVLTARFDQIPGCGTGCKLTLSLRDGLDPEPVQADIVAAGGNSP